MSNSPPTRTDPASGPPSKQSSKVASASASAEPGSKPSQPSKMPPPDDDDYDPHLYRELAKPTTNTETLIHLIKGSLGTGILAMPQAFGRTGVVMGIVGLVVLGVLVTYCLHSLLRSQYATCKYERVPLLDYPDAMAVGLREGPKAMHPLARFAPCTVNVFIVIYQLGIGCAYIVFIGDNIKAMVDPYYKLDVKLYMCMLLVPLLIYNLVRSWKVLTPFSLAANVLTLIAIIIVAYYLITQPAEKEPVSMFGTITEYPLYIGTALFALAPVGVVVALENNMKTPKSFLKPLGVLNIGMGFVVALYTVMGVLGYLMCRSKCRDSVTLNLPDDAMSTVVRVFMTIAVFISYGLQCNVPMDILWKFYVKPPLEKRGVKRMVLAEIVMRYCLVIITFLLAVAIPKLGLFISLFGALCLSFLGIAFPALLQACVLKMQGLDWGKCKWRLMRCIGLIIFAFLALVFGTYTAIYAIVKSFID